MAPKIGNLNSLGGQQIVHQHDPKSTGPQTYECDFTQEAGTYLTGSLNTYDRETGRGYEVSGHFPKITNQEEIHVHINASGPFLYFAMSLKAVSSIGRLTKPASKR